MRLGAPINETSSPLEWAKRHRALGYGAAYCPVQADSDDAQIREYLEAARVCDVVIAEVGAWSNPIDIDPAKAKAAFDMNVRQLALAERVGARCCVNVSGSRHPTAWAGPSPENLTPDTFALIVDTVRAIIDEVKPARTFYTLECMPWAYPDSVDNYLDLIRAIDRPAFGVHMDPCNLICSPQLLYKSGELLWDAARRLGPHIRSYHLKDLAISDRSAQVELREVVPGTGVVDYVAWLQSAATLGDVPMMIEHLQTQEQYAQAADYIKAQAKIAGVCFD